MDQFSFWSFPLQKPKEYAKKMKRKRDFRAHRVQVFCAPSTEADCVVSVRMRKRNLRNGKQIGSTSNHRELTKENVNTLPQYSQNVLCFVNVDNVSSFAFFRFLFLFRSPHLIADTVDDASDKNSTIEKHSFGFVNVYFLHRRCSSLSSVLSLLLLLLHRFYSCNWTNEINKYHLINLHDFVKNFFFFCCFASGCFLCGSF